VRDNLSGAMRGLKGADCVAPIDAKTENSITNIAVFKKPDNFMANHSLFELLNQTISIPSIVDQFPVAPIDTGQYKLRLPWCFCLWFSSAAHFDKFSPYIPLRLHGVDR
jgi:hypothetical protein